MIKTDSDEKKGDIRDSVQLNPTKTSDPNQKTLKSISDLNDKQVIIRVLTLQIQDLKVEYYNCKHQISVKKSELDNYKKKIEQQ